MRFWFRLPLRTRLGIIATILLTCVIVVLLLWYRDPDSFSYRTSSFLRFGPLIFLFWLAWADLEKIPWWNWLIMIAILLVCIIKPVAWFVGIPIIVYLLFVSRKQ